MNSTKLSEKSSVSLQQLCHSLNLKSRLLVLVGYFFPCNTKRISVYEPLKFDSTPHLLPHFRYCQEQFPTNISKKLNHIKLLLLTKPMNKASSTAHTSHIRKKKPTRLRHVPSFNHVKQDQLPEHSRADSTRTAGENLMVSTIQSRFPFGASLQFCLSSSDSVDL